MASLLASYYDLPPTPDDVPPTVRLAQNEVGRQLYFTIKTYETLSTTGATVTINGTKPDGNIYSEFVSIDEREVSFVEDAQLTAVAGAWDAKIRVVLGEKVLYTGRIHFIIDADTMDSGRVPSESVLHGVIERCEQAANHADAVKQYIETYIDGLVYGDEVYY